MPRRRKWLRTTAHRSPKLRRKHRLRRPPEPLRGGLGSHRRRFETGDITDLAVFESHWPQILTNFFYAETARVSRALGWLSEDPNN